MNDLTRGAISGLAATAPMTAAMAAMHRALPWWERRPLPPRQITVRLLRAVGLARRVREPARSVATLVGHFGYGAVAGAPFGPVARRTPGHPVLAGVAWGLGVYAASYLGWMRVWPLLRPVGHQPPRRAGLMIAVHVVWGAALGLAVGRAQRRPSPA